MRRNMYGVHKATGTKKILKQVFEKRVSCPPTKNNWEKNFKIPGRISCAMQFE